MEKKNVTPDVVFRMSVEQLNELLDSLATVFKDQNEMTSKQLFDGFSSVVRSSCRKYGGMLHFVLFVFKDSKFDCYRAAFYPMPILSQSAVNMNLHGSILRKLIGEMKSAETPDFQIVGLFKTLDGKTKMIPREQVSMDVHGKIDEEDLKEKIKDIESKDTLIVEYEDKFLKHSDMYEYVRFDDGQIVLKDTPFQSDKYTYDPREANSCSIAFLLAEPQSFN